MRRGKDRSRSERRLWDGYPTNDPILIMKKLNMNDSKSICWKCNNHREIVSGKGSVFLLCQVSQTEEADLVLPKVNSLRQSQLLENRSRWPKYPPQPLAECPFYVELITANEI